MFDTLIIGGGIIGMLSALELQRAGQRVCVLDQGFCGQESSWAGGGILSPLYPWRYPDAVSELAHWSRQRYPRLCAELAETTGINPEYTRNGLLILDAAEQVAARAWAERYGVALEFLDRAAVAACEPQLGEEPRQALWLPEVGQVRNPRLVRSLRQALVQQGVELREHRRVDALLLGNTGVRGVKAADEAYHAACVVLAAGAWSAGLLGAEVASPQVEPVRGQMLVFQAPAGLVSRIVLAQGRYVIPRRDGRVLVGSTLERVGFAKHTTDAAREELSQAAFRLIPALGDYPLERHWAGLRPGSPDGVPYIGPHPAYPGLYLNTGHYRNGVILGPASARLLADLVLGRETFTDPDLYAFDTVRPHAETDGYKRQ